jgi:glycosyltransferase involved in cell wall biosynthesis
MEQLRFTVIIGSYNHAKFADQAIDSLLEQTAPVDAILYFDDGSTDGTRDIVRRRLGHLTHFQELPHGEKNLGLIHRLVQANAMVSDGFVVPFSCDDVLTSRAVEIHREALIRAGAEWCIAATQVTDEALRPTQIISPPTNLRDHPDRLFEMLLSLNPWLPMTGWCYSIGLFRRIGGYDTRHRIEDYSLGLRLALGARPALSDEVVKYWRRFDGSYSIRFAAEMWRDHAEVAMEQRRYSLRLARRIAAEHYRQAAGVAIQSGRYNEALYDHFRAMICWPQPMKLGRNLARMGVSMARRALFAKIDRGVAY